MVRMWDVMSFSSAHAGQTVAKHGTRRVGSFEREAVLGIWNERVAAIRAKYQHLRTVVLVKSDDLLEVAVFEFDTVLYEPTAYEWSWNMKHNLEGRDKGANQHHFTWQPHGAHFTIIEEVPDKRLALRLKQPPALESNAVLATMGFDPSWVQVI